MKLNTRNKIKTNLRNLNKYWNTNKQIVCQNICHTEKIIFKITVRNQLVIIPNLTESIFYKYNAIANQKVTSKKCIM